jgi:hypothetical protein
MAPIPHRARYHRGPCGWRRIERGLTAGVGYRARAAKGSTTAAKRVVKAARTLDLSDDEIRAKMRCDKCGKRPERYYPANQSDTPGFVRSF